MGKTTVSSALAVHLAATHDDWKVLVISTDPAHSLGDALDVDFEIQQTAATLAQSTRLFDGRSDGGTLVRARS